MKEGAEAPESFGEKRISFHYCDPVQESDFVTKV